LENRRVERRKSFLRSVVFQYPFLGLPSKEVQKRSGLEVREVRGVIVATYVLSMIGVIVIFFALAHFVKLEKSWQPAAIVPGIVILLLLRYSIARVLIWAIRCIK
jgi:hypothetical protein